MSSGPATDGEPLAEPGGEEATDNRDRYKVVELSTVTDESIEETLNTWTRQGWVLDALHFAMRESSKRPSMAFLVFTRAEEKR